MEWDYPGFYIEWDALHNNTRDGRCLVPSTLYPDSSNPNTHDGSLSQLDIWDGGVPHHHTSI